MSTPIGKEKLLMVRAAIKELHPIGGSTARTISAYIAAKNNMDITNARRIVALTLRRGRAFGAIQMDDDGLYSVSDFRDYATTHCRGRRRSKTRRGGRRGRSGSRKRRSRRRR